MYDFSDAVIIVLKIILRKRKDARIREFSMKIFDSFFGRMRNLQDNDEKSQIIICACVLLSLRSGCSVVYIDLLTHFCNVFLDGYQYLFYNGQGNPTRTAALQGSV